MHVPEIIAIKDHLESLKKKGLVTSWELPYENILTRRSAAIFFMEVVNHEALDAVSKDFSVYEHFSYRENHEKKLSQLAYRITFNSEEKEKNTKHQVTA